MRIRNNSQLRLVALEDRVTPAAIVNFVGGNLTIRTDNIPNVVVLTQLAGNQIKVTDNAANLGTFLVTGNVAIFTGNSNDVVALNLTPAPGVFGNVTVHTGNGNDIVDLGGRILGNVILNTGNGNDQITANTVDLRVGGSVYWTDQVGLNTFNMNSRNFTIGSNMILNGVGVFNMVGGGKGGNTLSVGGLALMLATQPTANPMTILFNGGAANINGLLQIIGGAQNDVVSVTSKLSANGGMNLILAGGDNTFVLTPAAGGNGVGGNLSYYGYAGVDVAVFGAESSVAGSTCLHLGNGINTFVDTPTSLYAGNLSVTAGNGTSTEVILGMISGDLEVANGNGDGNTTVVTGSVAGKLRYRSGNGDFTVLTLAPAIASVINLDASFGAGSATLTLGPNVTLTGIVRGTPGALYTFNQGTAILGPNLTFVYFP